MTSGKKKKNWSVILEDSGIPNRYETYISDNKTWSPLAARGIPKFS